MSKFKINVCKLHPTPQHPPAPPPPHPPACPHPPTPPPSLSPCPLPETTALGPEPADNGLQLHHLYVPLNKVRPISKPSLIELTASSSGGAVHPGVWLLRESNTVSSTQSVRHTLTQVPLSALNLFRAIYPSYRFICIL